MRKTKKWLILTGVIAILIIIGYFLLKDTPDNNKPVMTAEQWDNLTWQQVFLVVGIIFGIGYWLESASQTIIINTNPKSLRNLK